MFVQWTRDKRDKIRGTLTLGGTKIEGHSRGTKIWLLQPVLVLIFIYQIKVAPDASLLVSATEPIAQQLRF